MISLNKKITFLKLNPLIIFKLQKIKLTKIGQLMMLSYPELLYTNYFNEEELNAIQNSLINLGLNYSHEIDLNNIPYLRKELIRFNFKEYQDNLYQMHHNENKNIEPLRYSDSLAIIKNMLFLYEQLTHQNIHPDQKILLKNFLDSHPYTTIADFVDINPNKIDQNTIDLISQILGIKLNDSLSHDEIIKRENQIFNQENLHTERLDSYINNFSSDEKIEKFITKRR